MKLLSSAKFLMVLSRCVEEAGFSKSFFPYFELQPKEVFFFFLYFIFLEGGKIPTSENGEFLLVISPSAACSEGGGQC